MALRRNVLNSRLPPIPPPASNSISALLSNDLDFTPQMWNVYWNEKLSIHIEPDHFRVYKMSDERKGPDQCCALILLHGGGFSGLTWSKFAQNITQSFICDIYAIDLRGHGETTTQDEDNISMNNLCSDVVGVIEKLELGNRKIALVGHSLGGALAVNVAQSLEKTTPVSALVVLDVVEGSALESLLTMPSVLRARPMFFETITQSIRWCFGSNHVRNLESARVSMPGQLKCSKTNTPATLLINDLNEQNDPSSSNTSVAPSQTALVEEDEEEEAPTQPLSNAPEGFHELVAETFADLDSVPAPSSAPSVDSIPIKASPATTSLFKMPNPLPPKPSSSVTCNDSWTSVTAVCGSEKSDSSTEISTATFVSQIPTTINPVFLWRIDLAKTEEYWRGWFEGLSRRFLSVTAPKLLLLAGVDRLDREMMVGHMQGRFEMRAVPHVGHVLHEDDPVAIAEYATGFLVRHKILTSKS